MERPAVFPEALVTESAGITVLSLPCPGPVVAGLTVRYGQADEPLATRGMAHLVEHLTLSDPSLEHFDANGHVALIETSFHVRGPADGAAGFLNRIARLLAEPDTTGLETNLRVLRTEANSRRFSQWSQDLHYRYGNRGPGVTVQSELGLYGADEAAVCRAARRMVQSAGAVAWMTCPPPDELDLSPLNVLPAPVAAPRLPLAQPMPACATGADNVCSVSFLLPRSYIARAAATLLAAEARQPLRTENGWSYGVNESWEILDGDTAHFMLVADCLPEHVRDVRDALLGVVEKFMVDGPTNESIERTVRRMEQALTDPLLVASRLAGEAIDHLLGRPPGRMLDAVLETKATPPRGFAQTIATAAPSALVLVPKAVAFADDHRFTPIANFSSRVAVGRSFQRTTRQRTPATDDHFILGVDGLSFVPVASPHAPITVLFQDCQAVLRWQDGARTLHGDDGFRLFVHPDDWSNGDQLTAAIDHNLPAEVVVELAQASRPARSAKTAPHRASRFTPKRFVVVVLLIVLGITGEWYSVAHNLNDPAPPPTTVAWHTTYTLAPSEWTCQPANPSPPVGCPVRTTGVNG
jgi:zinc protease